MKKSDLVKLTSLTAVLIAPAVANAADCVSGAVYDSDGSCTVPAGVTSMTIQAYGGGGGVVGGMDARSGAGGGSFCGATVTVVPAATLTITVGLGGVEATDGGASSVTGYTTVGNLVANGGSTTGGMDAPGFGGTTAACTVAGGTAFAGGAGGDRDNAMGAGSGGGGGSSATSLNAGVVGNPGAGTVGGTGGVAPNADGGDGGDGGDAGATGTNGSAPGGGAGGNGNGQDTNAPGTNGAAGRVTLSFQGPPPPPPPAAVAVPTLEATSLIALTGLLGGLVGWKRRRDHR